MTWAKAPKLGENMAVPTKSVRVDDVHYVQATATRRGLMGCPANGALAGRCLVDADEDLVSGVVGDILVRTGRVSGHSSSLRSLMPRSHRRGSRRRGTFVLRSALSPRAVTPRAVGAPRWRTPAESGDSRPMGLHRLVLRQGGV